MKLVAGEPSLRGEGRAPLSVEFDSITNDDWVEEKGR